MKLSNRSLLMVLSPVFLLGTNTASATAQGQPLSGNIQMTVDTAPTRINRSTLRQAAAEANDFKLNLKPQQAKIAPLLDVHAFEASIQETRRPPLLHAGAQDSAQMQFPRALQAAVQEIQRAVPTLKSNAVATIPDTSKIPPYIWYQSSLGGYFDGSQTTKELVRADKLYLYGGRFQDGTTVPKQPIHDYNVMGHAFRQAALPTQHFWDH